MILIKKLLFSALFLSLFIPADTARDASSDVLLFKVLIIGDSISIGYTPQVIQMLKGRAIVKHNQGNAGPTIRGRTDIDKWLGTTKWDMIHFNWGLWDMYGWQYENHNRTPPKYEKRLEKLVLRLKKTGAKLIWATTTPICPKVETNSKVKVDPATEREYLEAAMRVMEKHNIQVNDLYGFLAPVRDKYALADNDVHFTKEGYKKLGELVANRIKVTLGGESGVWWISSQALTSPHMQALMERLTKFPGPVPDNLFSPSEFQQTIYRK